MKRMGRPPKPRLEWNDPDLQIVPREKVKRVSVKRALEIEKRQNTQIRKLTGKVKDEKKASAKKSERLAKSKAKYKELQEKKKLVRQEELTNIIFAYRRRSQWAIGKARKQVKAIANQMVTEKLKSVVINQSRYIDGIISFPIITAFCKENNIQFTTFSIFVLLNNYEWFMPFDGLFFGHSITTTRNHLKILVELELASEIISKNRRRTYVCTPLGRKTFEDFKKFHDKRLKDMMDDYDKSFSAEGNPYQLKLISRRKYLHGVRERKQKRQQEGG